jgi:competence protein ComEC
MPICFWFRTTAARLRAAIFLDAVQRRIAWVQSGYRNRYGHPAPEVMQRYQVRGIVVHDSPHCGAMTWSTKDATEVRCHRTAEMRYWSHRIP